MPTPEAITILTESCVSPSILHPEVPVCGMPRRLGLAVGVSGFNPIHLFGGSNGEPDIPRLCEDGRLGLFRHREFLRRGWGKDRQEQSPETVASIVLPQAETMAKSQQLIETTVKN